jgi:chromosome transmission fidelity protein 18
MPNNRTVFRFCMCFVLVQYEYKMDPDVESVVCFPEVSRAIELSYGAKQLIAHEIELEKMRR